MEQFPQFSIGARGVAHVELHRLPGPHEFADRQRSGFTFRAEAVANQKVAGAELFLIFIDHASHV